MARIVFISKEEFEKWLDQFATKDRYALYTTEENEIIAYPLKTSRPLTYAYFKPVGVTAIDIAKACVEKHNLRWFKIKALEWSDDRPVGVKFIVE